ncbi:oligosaccharide flippase family protein [Rhodococcus sp. BL-253-APC-6A1W]|uniref:oligosaccharide flippase family protein n=1 Tax=Rhodococcus sp. BL-253-APC-6A1W TaxID=2725307 RepID=UPI003211E212
MGRHSRPDDVDDDESIHIPADLAPSGRHAKIWDSPSLSGYAHPSMTNTGQLHIDLVAETVLMERIVAKVHEDRDGTLHEPRQPQLDGRAARRNTVAMLGSRLAIASMGWAGSMILARVLAPDDFGKFSFVFGLLGVLSVVTDLGVGRVVLAKLVECNPWEVSYVTTAFIALRGVLGFIGYALAVGYVVLLGYSSDVVWATVVAGLVVVVATPSNALSVMYQSRLRMASVAAAETLGQLAQLVCTIAAVLWHPVLLVVVAPAVINEVVAAALKIRGVRAGKAGPLPAARAQLWRWREMLIEAVPLTIGFALLTVLSKVDVLMLGRMDTFDSVGLYTVGYKFADLLSMVASTVVGPVTTLLVATWPAQSEQFRQRTREAAMLLAVLGAAATAAFWPTADGVLALLYGERFAEGADASRMLVAGSALSMLTELGLMVLVATGRHRVYPWVALAALVANVAMNLVLIPRMSFEGAALATVLTEAVMVVAIWVVVARTVAVRRLFPFAQASAIAMLGVAVTVWASLLAEQFDVPWPITAVVAPLCVFAGVHFLPITGGLGLVGLVKSR